MSIFIPYTQRKTHVELKPADFVRVQGTFFIIDEVRRFRRPFEYTASVTTNITQLTGSLKKRFQHIDKFAVDPDEGVIASVAVRYRGTDITGLQFAHTWTNQNANVGSPNELDINSFSTEDIINIVLNTDGDVTLWFSGEEYTLVQYPSDTGPTRFVIVHPYGFSRVLSREEFEVSEMTSRLRT